ncbi:unnamed protein product [Adineta ricciae]|uniref:Uncharacterized protein n=3 Tax=Adineta ricciae TaxID=249248 RepID=A0A814F5J4_ADIRI|nr:unnamed protein product [Adineta ricciae]
MPKTSSSVESSSHTGPYANIHTYASAQTQNTIAPAMQTSAVYQTNNYFNISMLSSKQTNQQTDASYGKLLNTTSTAPLSKKVHIADKKNNHRIYENMKTYSSSFASTKIHQTLSNPSSSSSSIRTYINFEFQEDTSQIISLPSPNNKEKDIDDAYSPIHCGETKSSDIETNVLETNSNASTTKTRKKLEVNMAPNCGDKSGLYRTKIHHPIAQIHPTLRQRRTSHRSKRHRRRSITPFRSTSSNAVRRRQKRQSDMISNLPQAKHPHVRQKPIVKSVSNRLYNAVQQSIPLDNHSFDSVYSDEEAQAVEYPVQFHGALQNHIFAWYPTVTYNEDDLIPPVLSASENGESNHQTEIISKKDEDRQIKELIEDKRSEEVEVEEEDEEGFLPHDTFEDFLLRRPRKSSCSPSTSSTSTVISVIKPPRPPAIVRRSSGIALGLDKNDVDFIHNIIQRTHGEQRVSNRITALREAYVRAAVKQQNDIVKSKTFAAMNLENRAKKPVALKRSLVTSKIRDELERYDELPIHRRNMFRYDSDDDDDDEDDYDYDDEGTYSINDDYRFRRRPLPSTPSTAHRIISFISAVKRQLQKSFHDFRSRLVLETMTMSPNHTTRHKHPYHESRRHHASRPRTSHDVTRRNTTHHSNERLHPTHRHQLHRTHSNTSQVQHTHYYPNCEQHFSRKPPISRNIARQQRMTRKN